MLKKLEYLVIHCSDTPYLREITVDNIFEWHKGAKFNPKDGTFTFLSKTYTKAELKRQILRLPSGKELSADCTVGRGWSQVGYSDMIHRNGTLENLVPYDFNNIIDTWEVTNGATGYNSNSRHIVLAGGWSKDGNVNGRKKDGSLYLPEELYQENQLTTLKTYIQMQLKQVPTLKIIGHNEIAQKTCPNFDVQKFLKTIKL